MTANDESARILIAGGGIGGLTLTGLLQRRGIPFLVLERAAEFAAVGAGIVLQPNAVRALRAGGIADEILRHGQPTRALEIRDERGRLLSSLRTETLERAFGAGVFGFHRATLHSALLKLVDSNALKTASVVVSFEEDAEGVALRLATGEVFRGTALVGADGLRSAVRAQMLHDGEPQYAGYTSWRGVTKRGNLWPEGHMNESWGRGARVGLVSIDRDRLYWFATANAAAGGRDANKAELMRRFATWHAPIPAVIESTSEDAILRTDIADRPRAPSWSRGRVTLLGDAAHPMTPNLGQGGCQAIEDAVVLDRCLASEPGVAAAFKRYEATRIERTSRVVVEARRFGSIGQIENGFLRALRNLAVRATPDSATLRTLRWLYEFNLD